MRVMTQSHLHLKALTPLFARVGGKRKEMKKYIQYIPDDINTYLEPFVGGGATFFHLNHNKNVISDVHTELIEFYQSIKEDKMADIYNFMTEHANNEQTYLQIRDHMEINVRLDNAKRFYYLRKTCFRGMSKYDKKGNFNVSFNYRGKCNFTDLKNDKYVDLLKNTTILNSSFEYIFENYNDQNNFMFLDPPYDCKITNYGYCAFGKEEHKRLAECFKATNIRCLMIIGKTDFIEELYDGYIVEQYDKRYDINSIYKNVEGSIHLIIKNY
jgi:DNA adenine methylase